MNEITDPAAGIVAEAAPLVKKTCTKCGVEKGLGEFRPQRGRCKPCELARGRAYRQQPEVKERQRAYVRRLEVKERHRAHSQRPQYKEWKRAYMQRPEIREARREYLRAYTRERLQTDPTFKVVRNLRNRLNLALKGARKSARTLELLGCIIEELRAHLEAQFKPGMTWENQGRNGWHVDHIRPCASFDLTDPEQQRACFHYTNLQPLWAKENMSKGAKLLDSSPKA